MFIKSAVMMFLILGLSLHPSIAAPTTDTAHFTSEFTFFEMGTHDPERRYIDPMFLPVVSNTGRYVFAHVNNPVKYRESGQSLYERTLYFWDLSQPHSTLSPEPTQTLKFSQQSVVPWISFSPDDQFVALKSENELQVRHLPSLEIELSIAVRDRLDFQYYIPTLNTYSHLAWSRDSSRLAALRYVPMSETYGEDRVIVWNTRQKTIEEFFAGTPIDRITTLETAWLIHSTEYGFYHLCPFDIKPRLRYCLPMLRPPENYSLFTLPTGIMAANWPVDNHRCASPSGAISMRQLQATGYYGLLAPENISAFAYIDGNFLGDVGYYGSPTSRQMPAPVTFSPDGQYFFYEQSCDRKWGVWDFKNNLMVQNIVDWWEPTWLPDSRHFLVFDGFNKTLSLHEVGNPIPLDILKLNTLPGIQPLRNWMQLEAFGIWNISADGRHVMINLGHAGILVEIDYGQE
jgi:hypothetical protein